MYVTQQIPFSYQNDSMHSMQKYNLSSIDSQQLATQLLSVFKKMTMHIQPIKPLHKKTQ